MTRPAPARVAAVAGALLSVAAVLAAAWRAGERYATAYALRSAATISHYLAVVTPPARDRASGYDLAPLLVQARGLATLPGLGVQVEVYHGTAPLVRATGPSLSPDAFDEIRGRDSAEWVHGQGVAPLWDKNERDVVGAVAARPKRIASPLLSLWLLVGLLVALAAAWGAGSAVGRPSRAPLLRYLAASLMLGVGAYLGVRGAARQSTDRWLSDARLLVQDVAARAPRGRVPLADLARVGRGATLAVAPPATLTPRREASERGRDAVVAVRLSAGRWLELRTTPEDARTDGWLVLLVTLALLGPGATAVVQWGAGAVARPRELRTTAAAWGFLAPAAAHVALFAVGPLLFAAYVAVHRSTPGEPGARFVGLENFADLVRDPVVWTALRNTALFALSVPIGMALALTAALILQGSGRGVRLARAVLLLPVASSAVAVGLLWRWVYHADFGVLNGLLLRAGMPAIDWLRDPTTALIAVTFVAVWAQLGYQTAVFVAGLQAIPTAYLDAARADGAGAWRRFWHITLPLLRPVTLFVLVTGLIGAFQVFTLVYTLTGGEPGHATDVIALRIYHTAWESLRFGPAGALGLVLFAILLGVTWMQFRVLRRSRGHV
ncbi:MAG TPA: sugar ABC transporter permease [Gemmatimonadales bacterium]